MNLYKAELQKLKRSKLWLPLLLLPLLAISYGAINYTFNKEILTREWISLWTQVFLFYGAFFYPFIIGLIAALVWHNEHKKNGLRLILSSAYTFKQIITSKLLVIFSLLTGLQIYFLILYYLVGSFMHFKTQAPFDLIAWLGLVTLLSLVQVALQSFLSLRIKNFSVPVLLALVYGLTSFMACAQNKLPELPYLLGSAKLSLAMNNEFPNIQFNLIEWGKLFGWASVLTIILVTLQINYLKKLTH
ncbi:ABC transporter permease [Vaginisenegalia massiliensis]|uniref:ABC transporter permease n=1 Tax=Vaginisenegalia massiliensis TaxID=2058294 RepID=UPI000F546529|nr:ABC transporter permease [Vaginisenegalia massiliensis]